MANMMKGENYQFIHGDCFSELKKMESGCVNCVITSPPYWGLRLYDNADDSHEIGNETTLGEYVSRLSSVFREVGRVLSGNGSLWLNMGDRYIAKDLQGMPWRVAFALKSDGWIMRNDVIWHQMKGTQSCKDRLRDSYEHLFHFVKSKRYYYNADAIRIKPKQAPVVSDHKVTSSTGVSGKKYRQMIWESSQLTEQEKADADKALDNVLNEIKAGVVNDFRMTIRGEQRTWHGNEAKISGRAKELESRGYYIMRVYEKGHLPNDVWNIVTEDTWRKDCHCAVYPEELLRIPILSTCPEGGIVLDPFMGTGTTITAALKLKRRGIGIELSEKYIKTAEERIKTNISRKGTAS